MRIIGGELGGRRLKSIQRPGLRPTTDRVRESMFNMLAARIDFDERSVLDLFAGTGALGIEALSRGAAMCLFVERDRRAAGVIAENVASLGLDERATVTTGDAMKFLASTTDRYDLIFADPPYAATIFQQLVREVFSGEVLSPDGLFVLEHGGTLSVVVAGTGAEVVVEKSFGDTGVTVLGRV
jgi:16S rRNA (guanine(966)-N(2))-methyltransferase RsmD